MPFSFIYTAVGLRITPNKNAITAITSNKCIKLPTAVRKNAIAQPITSIKAIIYNKEFMRVVINIL